MFGGGGPAAVPPTGPSLPRQTTHDCRIYTLHIECGPDYPDKARAAGGASGEGVEPRRRVSADPLPPLPLPPQPPTVRFITRVNMPCVSLDGRVDAATFRVLRGWRRSCTLETLLTELRAEMAGPAARRLPQPPEGTTYE